MAKVFVALSGGVDSSVAAALLKGQGLDVYGVHMKMWSPRGSSQLPAPSYQLDAVCRQQAQDRIDAMRVAARLDIPFQTWDFFEEYRRGVVEYMIREYAAGRTPNPDVMCNRHIKFGLFLQRAIEAGADYVATGHYVRLADSGKRIANSSEKSASASLAAVRYTLYAARDPNKDQSYFLWTLSQEQLRYCLFPIGEYAKPQVREMAREFGLPTAEKPDSQGVCFVGELDVREFLKRYIPVHRGRVLTTAGRTVGEHEGAEFYTIGQREGLGIGGRPAERGEPRPKGAGGIPYYVAEKHSETNTLVVAEGPYDQALFRKDLTATEVNWISGSSPAGKFPFRCEARIRYRQPLQRCTIKCPVPSAQCHVVFDEPQRAVTPGQSIVFYQGDSFDPAQDRPFDPVRQGSPQSAQGREMLGGAVIC